ncbi:MAG TPA: HupE/UreJ family protein [Vicinamibacterales bacterium]|nr:HupE/UreJ family protein [Vicinamibacterales bacterium]
MAASISRPGGRRTVRWAFGLLMVLAVAGEAPRLAAHEIPASVVVRTFVKPEGARLRFALRLPLVSIRDFVIPARDGGVLLDLPRVEPMLGDMVRTWVLPSVAFFESGEAVGAPRIAATRIALPSDPSFASFDAAIAHFGRAPLDPATALPITDAWLDILIDYPIRNDRARFAIDPQFGRFGLRVVTTLRFQMPDGPERAFEFIGDPGRVELDPRWHQAAARFVRLGFAHILSGVDHLLFLICLVLPLRRFWTLVKVVTAFTVAHSITLACAAFGYAPDAMGFPALVEFLIALSIVYMAIENIVIAVSKGTGLSTTGFPHSIAGGKPVDSRPVPAALDRRWAVAFGFGLVHGFGFSFALKETLQFAGSHLVTSLVSFNVGVELGQIAVLLVVLPLLGLLFRYVIAEWLGIIVASAIVAHTAWHWLIERGEALTRYDWPVSGPAGLASLLRWVMGAVAVVGVMWLGRLWRAARAKAKS